MHRDFVNFLLSDLKATFLFSPLLIVGIVCIYFYFLLSFLNLIEDLGTAFMIQMSSMGVLSISMYVAIIFISPMDDERAHGISEHIMASLPYKIDRYLFFKILSPVILSCIFVSIYVLIIFLFTMELSVNFWIYATIFASSLFFATAVASFLTILTMLLPRKWKQPIMFLLIMAVIASPSLGAKLPISFPYVISIVLFAIFIALYFIYRKSLTERFIAPE